MGDELVSKFVNIFFIRERFYIDTFTTFSVVELDIYHNHN